MTTATQVRDRIRKLADDIPLGTDENRLANIISAADDMESAVQYVVDRSEQRLHKADKAAQEDAAETRKTAGARAKTAAGRKAHAAELALHEKDAPKPGSATVKT